MASADLVKIRDDSIAVEADLKVGATDACASRGRPEVGDTGGASVEADLKVGATTGYGSG